MLVSELLEKISHIENYMGPSNRIFNKDNWDKVGSGAQADVYSSKSNPNSVTKVANIANTDDATYKFVEMVMDNQSNPYFPRIYSAKVYDAKEPKRNFEQVAQEYMLFINMEKLIPVNNEKIRQMLPVLFNQIGIKSDKGGTDEVSKNEIRDFGTRLWELFGTPEGRQQIISDTKIPELKEALTLTKNLIEGNPNFRPDLHEDNVMVRLTGSGPQLVIVDPAIS